MKTLALSMLTFLTLSLSAQIRYIEPVFPQTTVNKNIAYGINASILLASQLGEAVPQTLQLDLYEPFGDTASLRPLVLVLPGGFYLPANLNGTCIGSKNDSSVVEICTRLAKMGYLAAAVDYRLGWNPVSPNEGIRKFTFLQALYRGVQDARTAIRFFKKTVVEDANVYRVDISRIVLWGESGGGDIALSAAFANTPVEWNDPSFLIPPGVPIIIPSLNGNLWGTDLAVNDAVGNSINGFPVGDTLCYPNWPSYSSDFQLCVSMAGALPIPAWVGSGEMPAILFHAPNDALLACGDALLLTPPPINLSVTNLSGSCSIAARLDLLGNNQVFWDANITDCITDNAFANNGGLEGFYPFTGLQATKGRPWTWTAPCPNNPTGAVDGAFARAYIDTVFAYFAPRACAALALCNAPSDPTGICGTQARGITYLDVNQNATYDPGDQAMPNIVVELQPGGLHALSGQNGNFSFNAPPGNYTLNVPTPPTYFVASNVPVAVTVPVGGDVTQNIAMHATATVNDLMVSITPFGPVKPGFYNSFIVHWKNVGTTQLTGNVSLQADQNYILLTSIPVADITGNTATWTFSNLAPLQSGSAYLQVHLPFDAQLGTDLTSTAIIEAFGLSDETPVDNIAVANETVVGAFDPNDKQVIPPGDVTQETLEEFGGWLDYTVRFQNTGTAPAANVHIVDTLSELLNINTLEIIGSSHAARLEITGRRTLTWYFDNINLADSVNNEPASHGFVRYRVKPIAPFAEIFNKTARNFADIYFDFNTAVRTNTTETTFIETSNTNSPSSIEAVQIVPNPVTEVAMLYWTGLDNGETVTLRVWNAAGEMVLRQELPVSIGNNPLTLAVKNWPKSLYFVQLQTGSGIVSGRFVKG